METNNTFREPLPNTSGDISKDSGPYSSTSAPDLSSNTSCCEKCRVVHWSGGNFNAVFDCGCDCHQSTHSKGKCVCGESSIQGVTHRQDGPCVVNDIAGYAGALKGKGESWEAEFDAIMNDYDGPEFVHETADSLRKHLVKVCTKLKPFISKLLSDRDERLGIKGDYIKERQTLAAQIKKYPGLVQDCLDAAYLSGLAAGATAERAKIAERFLQTEMSLPALHAFKEWLTHQLFLVSLTPTQYMSNLVKVKVPREVFIKAVMSGWSDDVYLDAEIVEEEKCSCSPLQYCNICNPPRPSSKESPTLGLNTLRKAGWPVRELLTVEELGTEHTHGIGDRVDTNTLFLKLNETIHTLNLVVQFIRDGK